MKKTIAAATVAAPAALAVLFASPSLAANAYVPPSADAVITVPGAWVGLPDFIPTDWNNETDNPRIAENWYTAQAGVTPVVLGYHRDPILAVDYNLESGSDALERDVRAQLADGKTNIVVATLSQGTGVANATRAKLDDLSAEDKAKVTFIEMGSPFRGIASVLPQGFTVPGFAYTVNHPEDYGFNVTVVNGQYDGWADPPKDLFNPLAVANAVLGMQYVHTPTALMPSDGLEPVHSTTSAAGGTTTTYLVPTKQLPITRPVRDLGVALAFGNDDLERGVNDAVDGLDRVLKPAIEGAYDRDFDGKADGPQKALADWNKVVVSTTAAAIGQRNEHRATVKAQVTERRDHFKAQVKQRQAERKAKVAKAVERVKSAVSKHRPKAADKTG